MGGGGRGGINFWIPRIARIYTEQDLLYRVGTREHVVEQCTMRKMVRG